MPYSLFSKEFEKEGVRQVKAHVKWVNSILSAIASSVSSSGRRVAQESIPFPRHDQMDYAPVVHHAAFR